MTTCQACGGQINASDRFCRNCGAPIATLVEDLVDTHPFDPSAPSSAPDPRQSHDTRDQFHVPTGCLDQPGRASSAASQATSQLKQFLGQGRNWLLIAPLLILLLALFIGAGFALGRAFHRDRPWTQAADRRGRVVPPDPPDADESAADDGADASADEAADGDANEAVQNALGFVPSDVSDDEYPGIQGVFVGSLTSDQGPAAIGHIQAGDVLTELGDNQVTSAGDIARALKSLEPGAEVGAKVYRDGETIPTRIKIADPSHPPFEKKTAAVEQGFMGLGDVERRCCIPGTRKWGLEIQRIVDNSPADLAGLQPGDVITEFDKHPIRTPDELTRRIRAAAPRSKVLVRFYRGATEQTAEVLIGHLTGEDESDND